MLLYTRLATPKEPKRRSRGGCIFCKEKKKKCDEKRPKCSRCTENGVDCTYGTVKPRQRRRRESAPLTTNSALESALELYTSSRRLSQVSCYSQGSSYTLWEDSNYRRALESGLDECPLFSPTESFFAGYSFGGLSPVEPRILEEFPNNEGAHDAKFFFEGATSEGDDAAEGTETLALAPQSKSLVPDLAVIAPCPTASPLRDFFSPAFSEFSDRPNRRALIDHFCNNLSHLIVFREETGNPFQQLVLPLTTKSPPVLNAIFALACAHLEYRGIETPEKALYFHNRAIQGVAQMIQQNDKVNRTETLAAIMLLVYYECLVQNGGANMIAGHLKGALTIMCMDNSKPEEPSPAPDPASIFLQRAFCFYDVINALSHGTAPLSATPKPGYLVPLSPLGAPIASPLCDVDTLLGMATTLWPIIHRLSGLSGLKAKLQNAIRNTDSSATTKAAVLRAEFARTAQAIESALTQWQPVLPHDFSPDTNLDNDDDLVPDSVITDKEETKNIQSIYHNAIAYRHASLVYLYKAMLRYDRAHALVQKHTELTLKHCVRTVGFKGPMSALLWPLFVAACEASTDRDRELAKKVFGEIEKRQGMRNINSAWNVVKEVWQRVDLSSSPTACDDGDEKAEDEKQEELWRVVSREMGVSIVFG